MALLMMGQSPLRLTTVRLQAKLALATLLKLFHTRKRKMPVNEAGNYTKPQLRKNLFRAIKAGNKGGKKGQWSARKAQLLALRYKKAGGGYTS